MKIFVTVGAQMPFDRLIAAVDAWAELHPEHEVRAQIGESDYRARALSATRFLPPPDFDAACRDADAIVGHAGIGTLFAAMQHGKPVLVLTREAARRETRNDHQIATARRFAQYAGVEVAWTAEEVGPKLDALVDREGQVHLEPVARGPLVRAIRAFVDG